jgi:hypothetical protein
MQKDPRGTHIRAISHHTVSWAVSEVVRTLGDNDLKKLKVRSGEHLAAILATAFLGAPPVHVDTDGGPDLVFDLTRGVSAQRADADLIGRTDVQFADFEVKSLPGAFRKLDADLDKAIAAGAEPNPTSMTVTFVSANEVVRGAGQKEIEQARKQLARKSSPERARNVFLIAHFFDYPVVEIMDAPIVAHHLDSLDLAEGVDSVWVLFAPHSLTVWSAALGRWTSLLFDAIQPSEHFPDTDRLDLLQQIDLEFLKQTGTSIASPYVFALKASGEREPE